MTTETKHTPGPWKVSAPGSFSSGINVHAGEANKGTATYIALAGERGTECEAESLANARLIAAAPMLLEALVVLVDHAQETHPHFESPRGQADIAAALAAIARATK